MMIIKHTLNVTWVSFATFEHAYLICVLATKWTGTM